MADQAKQGTWRAEGGWAGGDAGRSKCEQRFNGQHRSGGQAARRETEAWCARVAVTLCKTHPFYGLLPSRLTDRWCGIGKLGDWVWFLFVGSSVCSSRPVSCQVCLGLQASKSHNDSNSNIGRRLGGCWVLGGLGFGGSDPWSEEDIDSDDEEQQEGLCCFSCCGRCVLLVVAVWFGWLTSGHVVR